jgi:membrane protease YdiL (CAAX protease family)
MKYLLYILSPLAILFTLISLACILGYSILMIYGDFYSLTKLISRLSQILLVLSVFLLRRYVNLSWSELGFSPKAIFFKQIVLGFVAGLFILLPVFFLLYHLDVSVWNETKTWTLAIIAKKITIALLLSLLISVVEEPVFRGLLLSSMQKKLTLAVAVTVSAFYYGSLHFLRASSEIAYRDITFRSGFDIFAEAISNWLNPAIGSAFISLVMVGLFLGVVRTQFKQSLGLCIGLHASWVLQIKLSKTFFSPNYNSGYAYLVSPYDGVIGSLTTVWLLLVLIAYFSYRYWQKTPQNS